MRCLILVIIMALVGCNGVKNASDYLYVNAYSDTDTEQQPAFYND